MRRIILAITATALGMLAAAWVASATPAHAAVRRHKAPAPRHAHLVKHALAIDAHVIIPPSAMVKRKPRARHR